MKKVDTLIVGAGITGITAASILAREKKKTVLLVEKRNHIGGNCYDCLNEEGLQIHLYGPHIFHTKHKDVWDYLSLYTDWLDYVHKVKAFVNGKFITFPININTFEQLFGKPFSADSVKAYIKTEKVDFPEIKNAEEMVISRMGKTIYDTFFKNYTQKQWGIGAKRLSPEITRRIPLRFDRDERFFTDPYQGVPTKGYTSMFKAMLDHENIELITGKSFEEIKDIVGYTQLIYTGAIDEFFNYKYGSLPYRGIRFSFNTLEKEYYQPVAVVNYPNDYNYTRVSEFKYMTSQKHPKTTICLEYPSDTNAKNENIVPSYPVLNSKSSLILEKYLKEAQKNKAVSFLGRLGRFEYLNMDTCVKLVIDYITRNKF